LQRVYCYCLETYIQKFTDVSKERRVSQASRCLLRLLFDPEDGAESRQTCAILHGITYKKIILFIVFATITSDLTQYRPSYYTWLRGCAQGDVGKK
jgi:hypothetical protein